MRGPAGFRRAFLFARAGIRALTTRKKKAVHKAWHKSRRVPSSGKKLPIKRQRGPVRTENTSRRKPAGGTKRFRRAVLMAPRQVAVRAQEAAFQLLVAVDRGELVHRFLRWYAIERKRPGRISDAGRYRELVDTIRREAFLVLALRVEAEAPLRLGVRESGKAGTEQAELIDLFREEFYTALGRSLDFSDEEFSDFCRDLEVYRGLIARARETQSRTHSFSSPAGPFVDRCGFLLDSPMLDQGRHAAAKFELELQATASSVLRKVFSRRFDR
jgi:hypothetical protein